MNYVRIYNSLIDRARYRIILGYKERHHVIPKCMGGSNDKENIVLLTPEEHYVAHQLLVKINPGNIDLIWAALAMQGVGRGKGRIHNKSYGWLKKKFSQCQIGRKLSEEVKKKIGIKSRERNRGENHPMFGRTHSEETKIKIGIANTGKKGPRKSYVMSDGTKEKLRIAQSNHQKINGNPFLGKKHSEETKAKMKAYWAMQRLKS